MPELPECEANRRRVEAHCLHRTIEAIKMGETSHMDLPGKNARGRLTGRQFTETRRRGKAIFAGSQTGPWIVVSLGMTGSLRPYEDGDTAPDHARMTFVFEGGRRLAFRCPRKLGWIRVIDRPDDWIAKAGLGPDAMDIDRDTFADRVGSTRGAVKSALMAQKKIAGIGNLWSDEALFHAGLSPDSRGDALTGDQLDTLFDCTHNVLGRLLDANADYSRIPKEWLFPHRQEGATCPTCGGTITRKKVGGRSAFYCPDHQPRT
ncbi:MULTISPECIES: Fpg/Nei family DNA glycosylase [unclassified Roseovarius]|uniref:Fpg/Nei family DNA glycosylase n=1 Tax=unclassified Roseovarius TaxID=2614913 RepID=UPI00273CF592|nr:DNA-formamidopyrimidine glycosylase family protein [Roseovarius sp. MMSF_3350]